MIYKIDNDILFKCFMYKKISTRKRIYTHVIYTKIKNDKIFFKAYYFDSVFKSYLYKIAYITFDSYNKENLCIRKQKLIDIGEILKRKPNLTDYVKVILYDYTEYPQEINIFFNDNFGRVVKIEKYYSGNVNYKVEFEKNIPKFNDKIMDFSLSEIIIIMSIKEYRKSKLKKICLSQEIK